MNQLTKYNCFDKLSVNMKRSIVLILLFSFFMFFAVPFSEAKKPTSTPKPTRTPTPTPTLTLTPIPTPILGTANLYLNASGPTQVQSGQIITYIISVTNLGPDVARDVEFCSALSPSGFGLVGLDQGTWDSLVIGGASGRYLNCSMWGSKSLLPPGESVYMNYAISDIFHTTITNTIETSSINFDSDLSNNISVINTVITP